MLGTGLLDSTPYFLNCGDHPRTPVNVDAVITLPAANFFVKATVSRAVYKRVNAIVSRARDSLLNAQ